MIKKEEEERSKNAATAHLQLEPDLLRFIVAWRQVLFLERPVVTFGLDEPCDGHEDDDNNVQTGEDVVEPEN